MGASAAKAAWQGHEAAYPVPRCDNIDGWLCPAVGVNTHSTRSWLAVVIIWGACREASSGGIVDSVGHPNTTFATRTGHMRTYDKTG